MPHDVAGQALDVVRRHKVASRQKGMSTGGPDQGDRGPRAGTQLEQGCQGQTIGGRLAGGPDEVDDVFLDRGGDPDRRRSACGKRARRPGRKVAALRRSGDSCGSSRSTLGRSSIRARSRDRGSRRRSFIKNRSSWASGKGIGSLMLDRVLRGQHPESLGKDDRFVTDGDLAFLHGFQQRALDLGRGAVDLVGEQDAGDDRSGADVECSRRGAVDLGPGQVGRQQVGSKLDAAKRKVERLRQRPDCTRLGQPGHALDQDMSAGQQSDDQPFQQGPLSDHQVFHPLDQPLSRSWAGENR